MEDDPDVTLSTEVKWVPLSITAEYPQGDTIGKFLAFSSMLPFAILWSFLTLILFRRDLHTISYFVGLVVNEGVNYVFKHTLRQPRPLHRPGLMHEYGMPSSHAQFMWFFSSYMFLFLWVRLRHINSSNTLRVWLWKTAITIFSIFVAIVVGISRVYLHYHTTPQVLFGALLGTLLGILWFLLTQLMLTPLFPTVTSWRICEWLLIRDQTLIPNILWFEYTSHRHEIRARSRKLVSMKSQ